MTHEILVLGIAKSFLLIQKLKGKKQNLNCDSKDNKKVILYYVDNLYSELY